MKVKYVNVSPVYCGIPLKALGNVEKAIHEFVLLNQVEKKSVAERQVLRGLADQIMGEIKIHLAQYGEYSQSLEEPFANTDVQVELLDDSDKRSRLYELVIDYGRSQEADLAKKLGIKRNLHSVIIEVGLHEAEYEHKEYFGFDFAEVVKRLSTILPMKVSGEYIVDLLMKVGSYDVVGFPYIYKDKVFSLTIEIGNVEDYYGLNDDYARSIVWYDKGSVLKVPFREMAENRYKNEVPTIEICVRSANERGIWDGRQKSKALKLANRIADTLKPA